jgi:hypothetical protein
LPCAYIVILTNDEFAIFGEFSFISHRHIYIIYSLT